MSEDAKQPEEKPDAEQPEEKPENAIEEILREVQDAEHRTRDSAEQRSHKGEAGEAITPNTEAQEESQGE
ncbi:hypothetical protein [Streptomyces sp. PSKA30]|uniref:hypothetical protein n=1 Tax=Streptomyces sp. PSKA30 TaxID=2874597 RepID=UPI001CD1731F|nr:hypothetical protein [Streptomyces sp. PSKA30]MBZ9639553.1 hypothetical protein [Streptomyces sp. PSKA30]